MKLLEGTPELLDLVQGTVLEDHSLSPLTSRKWGMSLLTRTGPTFQVPSWMDLSSC